MISDNSWALHNTMNGNNRFMWNHLKNKESQNKKSKKIKLTQSKYHTLSKTLKNHIIMIQLKTGSFYHEFLVILKSKTHKLGNQCQIVGFVKNGNILWLSPLFILW